LVLAFSKLLLEGSSRSLGKLVGDLSTTEQLILKGMLGISTETKMHGVELLRSQSTWHVSSKLVHHIIVAAGFSLSKESWVQVRNCIIALAHNLAWSEGEVGWERSAEGVNQSLLLTELKLVHGEVVIAGRKFSLRIGQDVALEVVRNEVRRNKA